MFKDFNVQVSSQFNKMCATGKLFRVNVSGDKIWDTYISSFKNNPIFRDPESTSHNCNQCKNFIRRYGNIVSINTEGGLESMFSNISIEKDYKPSVEALDKLITSASINNVFFETYNELNQTNYESCKKNQPIFQLGLVKNVKRYTREEAEKFGVVKPNELRTFYHFNVQLPKQFVDTSGKSIEKITSEYRDKYKVFKRAMEEIPLNTLNLVKDLINQGSLLDGTAHLHAIEKIISLVKVYNDIKTGEFGGAIDNFCWYETYTLEERTAKFKNTLIGVLCTELAEGMELNKACENWNKRVDPVNYHKATAPITQRQIEEARKFVENNGFTESFNRRLATIDDIKVDEILHSNVGDGTLSGVSIFDNVKPTSSSKVKSFDNVKEISIDDFMTNVLPKSKFVEVYLQNNMEGNMCVLTKAVDDDSKPIFKWSNNYSWTFNGNLAGKSQIKEAVKSHGGKTDGVLRFSLNWAEDNWSSDNSDLDAHCRESNGEHIFFSHKKSYRTGGNLDVDIIRPVDYNHKNIVENITYPSINKMIDGEYKFYVNQYSARNSQGFKAEIEFDGNIYSYKYDRPVIGNIKVATITLKDGKFSIKHTLKETNQSKEIWNLETNKFHKVNLICKSPNHWGDNKSGNLHYMFMLDNCSTKSNIRAFHNENLLPELLKHRKVMEVLGATNMIEPKGKYLAGIGFNSTIQDNLILKTSEGMFKVLFKSTISTKSSKKLLTV